MILIKVKNAEDVTRQYKGRFRTGLGRLVGVNFQKRVEEKIAEELKNKLDKEGIDVEIVTKSD